MPRKRLDEREARRIATRKARHGDDFDARNARHAGLHTPTKFNSTTGKDAAKIRWKKYREEQARKLREGEK